MDTNNHEFESQEVIWVDARWVPLALTRKTADDSVGQFTRKSVKGGR